MKKFLSLVVALAMVLAAVPAVMAEAATEEGSMDNDLLAYVSFDKWLEPEAGGAEALGTASYLPALYGNGAYFSGSYANRVMITDAQGNNNLLVGKDAVTISFFENRYGDKWPLFISPTTNDQVYRQEKYIALYDDGNEIKIERYVGDRDDKTKSSVAGVSGEKYPSAAAKDGWRHVAIVLTDKKTDLYVDGEMVATAESGSKLSDLFTSESYISIGGGDWPIKKDDKKVANETFEGLIDEFRIYGRELTADEIALLAAAPTYTAEQIAASLTIPDENGVLDNLDLPTEKDGAKISWKSSDTAVITDEAVTKDAYTTPAGVVKRDGSDHSVKLTATVSLDGKTAEKTFDLTVKALEPIKDEDMAAYLYVYFRGNVNESPEHLQIHMATSEDGYHWKDLNGNWPVLTSTFGTRGLRDPYLLRSRYGDKFYLIATDLDTEAPWDSTINKWGPWSLAGSKHLMVWESTDLVHWSEQRAVKFANTDIGCAWAPESIYDPDTGEYLVYASGKDMALKAKEGKELDTVFVARTRDFRSFSEPEIFFIPYNEKGERVAAIDSTIIHADDGKFYHFFKYNGLIHMMVSDHASGEYKNVDAFNSKNIGGEGPAIYKVNGTEQYALCVDNYSVYVPYLTENISSGEFVKSTGEVVMPTGSKHGGMIPITRKEYEALLAEYGPESESENGSGPDLSYNFENESIVKDRLKGSAAITEEEGHGKVLGLDGSSGTYFEFPKGTFDRRDSFTLIFDLKSSMEGNFFTFALGNSDNDPQNPMHYLFFRARKNNLRIAETISGNGYVGPGQPSKGFEKEAYTDAEGVNGKWARIALVVKPGYLAIYKDGKIVAESDGLTVANGNGGVFTTSHIGTEGLVAYLGKSLFAGDPYMTGSFDNVDLYYRSLSEAEIFLDANPDMSDDAIIDAEIEAMSVSGGAVNDINLPTEGRYGTVISWASSNEAVISADGKVTRPATEEGDAEVTLTATYEYNGQIKTVAYKVKVKAKSAHEQTSTADWTGSDIGGPVTDKAYIEFDLIPNKDNIDGFIGISSSAVTPAGWGDYAIAVRPNTSGKFDAHNGTEYKESNEATYTAGKLYHFTIVADVSNKKYSAWVTNDDGETVQIADNFSFRSKAGSDLSNVTVRGGNGIAAGEFSVEDFKLTNGPTAEASLGWDGENFTINFTATPADAIKIYSEADKGTDLGKPLSGEETGIALSTADTNRQYRAAAALGEFVGDATAPVSIYSLVAQAVVDYAFDGEINPAQLKAAKKVLDKGGVYIVKDAEGNKALTPETAKLMAIVDDTVKLNEKAVNAGLRFANVSYAVGDGDIAEAAVSEDGTYITIAGLNTMDAEVVYLEEIEFSFDEDSIGEIMDEDGGDPDFVEEI